MRHLPPGPRSVVCLRFLFVACVVQEQVSIHNNNRSNISLHKCEPRSYQTTLEEELRQSHEWRQNWCEQVLAAAIQKAAQTWKKMKSKVKQVFSCTLFLFDPYSQRSSQRKLRRSVIVKYLLVFQFPFLDRYSYSIFHSRVFSRYLCWISSFVRLLIKITFAITKSFSSLLRTKDAVK